MLHGLAEPGGKFLPKNRFYKMSQVVVYSFILMSDIFCANTALLVTGLESLVSKLLRRLGVLETKIENQ